MRQLVYIFVLCGFFSWESWSQSLTEQEQLLREGRRLEECLDYQSAYPVYLRCLELDSTSVEAINAMARVSMNVGKTGEARSYFQKTLRQDSTNFYANISWRACMRWKETIRKRSSNTSGFSSRIQHRSIRWYIASWPIVS